MEYPKASNENFHESTFANEVDELRETLKSAWRNIDPVEPIINAWPDPIYIKSADAQILFANSVYEHTFAGTASSVGRFSADYLNDTIKPVSRRSDALMIAGCTFLEFRHPGRDQDGRSLLLRSIKRSLLGCGHTRAAVLGVTRIVEVTSEDSPVMKMLDLSAAWERFSKLDQKEIDVATLVSKGESVKHMAKLLGVSDKTVENRRNAAMRAVGANTQADLIRLMVRFQDNGFGDFGL